MTKMNKVLLTGGSGMVGRNILAHYKSSEWNIISPSSKEMDLSNFESTFDFVQKIKPEIIIHAAGRVGGINANLSYPVDFLVTNLDFGRNIILAARHAGVKRMINLGSSCMYPRNAPNPLSEELILQGELEPTNEGYALAKIIAARLCSYINKEDPTFEFKTMIPCNLYGPYDKFEPEHSHLIPAIIHKTSEAVKNKELEIEIWGDGTARREFMYSGDAADAIFYALNNFDNMPFLLNIGVGYDYSVNEFYSATAKIMNYDGKFIHNLEKPVGMKQKSVSIVKQTAWGWKPKTSLIKGIQETYNFYTKEVNK
jgi:GDP-L-fucose synthase